MLFVGITEGISPGDFSADAARFYDYYYESPKNEKKIALSFDDGPDPKYTPIILDILREEHIQANFFLLGKNAIKYPDLVRQIHADGHEIGNHSFTHSHSVHKSEKRLKMELLTTEKIIEDLTGEKTLLYRPPFLLGIGVDPTLNPYIKSDPSVLWATEMGFIPVGADIDSRDWLAKSPEDVSQNIIQKIGKGHITLLHDGEGNGAKHTVLVLRSIIQKLKSEGYVFTTVSDVLGISQDINIQNVIAPASSDTEFSSEVTELQSFLQAFDFNIEKTGIFDGATQEALWKWEDKYGKILEHNFHGASTDENTNGEVSLLQEFLKGEGYLDIFVTGEFDQKTQDALKDWQKKVMKLSDEDPEFGMVGEKISKKIQEQTYIPLARVRHQTMGSPFLNFLDNVQISVEVFCLWVYEKIGSGVELLFLGAIFLTFSRMLFVLGFFLAAKIRRRVLKESYSGGVSVLIPAYNEEENIAATIESILTSDYHLYEIIVIDDGSTDNTSTIVAEKEKNHPQVRLVTKENGGKASALNLGVSFAKYDVVISMDGDTIFMPDTITKLARHFFDPRVSGVAGKVCVANQGRLLAKFQSIEYVLGQNIEKTAFSFANAISVIPGPIGAWRKKDVVAMGGYHHDTLVEDQDLTLAILTKGKRILYDEEAICYTETPSSLGDFLKQRFRWIFGTIQCFWKYKSWIFSIRLPALGWIILPNTLMYSILTPLISLVIDLVAILSFIFGGGDIVFWGYITFTAFDLLYALAGFLPEKKSSWKLILFLPLQRIVYRFLLYWVVLRSLLKAIEGSGALWNKVKRTGECQNLFQNIMSPHKHGKKPIPIKEIVA